MAANNSNYVHPDYKAHLANIGYLAIVNSHGGPFPRKDFYKEINNFQTITNVNDVLPGDDAFNGIAWGKVKSATNTTNQFKVVVEYPNSAYPMGSLREEVYFASLTTNDSTATQEHGYEVLSSIGVVFVRAYNKHQETFPDLELSSPLTVITFDDGDFSVTIESDSVAIEGVDVVVYVNGIAHQTGETDASGNFDVTNDFEEGDVVKIHFNKIGYNYVETDDIEVTT